MWPLRYHVLKAEGGYAAPLLAKSSPDLVIVDYAMPGLTGGKWYVSFA